MQVEPGTIIEGKVTGITPFGAFVSFGDGKTGLVHISEIALEYVKNIRDHLKENDMIKAKVLSVDVSGKISLSIKQAILEERAAARKNARNQPPKKPDDIDLVVFNMNEPGNIKRVIFGEQIGTTVSNKAESHK